MKRQDRIMPHLLNWHDPFRKPAPVIRIVPC
jgi:hypothetical protein